MKVVLNLFEKKGREKKESAFEFWYASNDATKIPRYRKRNPIEEGERSFVPQECACYVQQFKTWKHAIRKRNRYGGFLPIVEKKKEKNIPLIELSQIKIYSQQTFVRIIGIIVLIPKKRKWWGRRNVDIKSTVAK